MMRPSAPDMRADPPKPGRWQFFKHPLTDSGIATFLKDWEANGRKI
jgi:transaldolase